EPGAGHQQHGVGDDVPGHHELEPGARGAQAGVDRGGGDVDDGGVEQGHELPGEHDGQDETGTHRALGAAEQAGAQAATGGTRQDVGHASSLVPSLSRYLDTVHPGTDTTWKRSGGDEAGPVTSYELGTNQVNSGQTRSACSKLTLSYRFPCSVREPP